MLRITATGEWRGSHPGGAIGLRAPRAVTEQRQILTA